MRAQADAGDAIMKRFVENDEPLIKSRNAGKELSSPKSFELLDFFVLGVVSRFGGAAVLEAKLQTLDQIASNFLRLEFVKVVLAQVLIMGRLLQHMVNNAKQSNAD
jgi:hypothetical protein